MGKQQINLSAAIIGGGRSTRFGKPKSFAKFRGRPLVEHSLDLARRLCKDIFIVSDAHLNYRKYRLPIYHDLYSGRGPIGGVYTALYHAKSDYVLTVPVDMPLLVPQVYRTLLQQMQPDRPVVALSESGMEPLVAVWPKQTAPALKQAIEQDRLGLYKLLRRLEAVHVFMPKSMDQYREAYFHNINYQQDLMQISEESKMTKPLPEHFKSFRKNYPQLAEIHEKLGELSKQAGPLDAGSVRLVKLALALAGGLEGAVHSHTRQALEEGIDAEALRHVALLAIPTLGFPRAMTGLSWINDETESA